jgi:DNA-binding protein HU-beta
MPRGNIDATSQEIAPPAKKASPPVKAAAEKKAASRAKGAAAAVKKAAAPAKKSAPVKAASQVTITLKQMAAELAEGHDLPRKVAESVLADLVTLATQHLKNCDEIRLTGLGILQVRARIGRNPHRRIDKDCGRQEDRFPTSQGTKGRRVTGLDGRTVASHRYDRLRGRLSWFRRQSLGQGPMIDSFDVASMPPKR